MRDLKDYYDRMYKFTEKVDLSRHEKTHEVKVFLSREIEKAFYRLLEGEKIGSVLDVGCGRGDNLFTISNRFSPPFLVGIDISYTILAFAQKRLRERKLTGVFLINCRAEALPFKEGSFHTALATEVLEHLPHDREGIREAGRVLDAEGLLIVATPTLPPGREQNDHSLEEVLSQERDRGGHFRQYSFSRLESRLRQGGFKVEKWYSSGKRFYRLARRLNKFCIVRARRLLGVSPSGEDPYLTTYLSSQDRKARSRLLINIYSHIFLPAWNAISDLDNIFQRRRPGIRVFIKARKSL